MYETHISKVRPLCASLRLGRPGHMLCRERIWTKNRLPAFGPVGNQPIALLSKLYLGTCLFSSVRNRRDIRPLDVAEQWTHAHIRVFFRIFIEILICFWVKWVHYDDSGPGGLLVSGRSRFGDKTKWLESHSSARLMVSYGHAYFRHDCWTVSFGFGRRGCNKRGFLFPCLEFWLSFSSFVERRLFCGRTENRELNSYEVFFDN